ncbi:hypothetical protein Nm8I071_46460 [Nonomuraea sp. TT08I-71]|nr:hypothetical protein Nm8I071_46460 [Nonomuraea sp. TT08I-71]
MRVTPAALAAAGQPSVPANAAASSAVAHHRPRRVIVMVVPIRVDAAGNRLRPHPVVRARGRKGSTGDGTDRPGERGVADGAGRGDR